MTPEDKKIAELEARLKEAKDAKEQIRNAQKHLNKTVETIGKAYEEYQNLYDGILKKFEWTEATASKRGVKRPSTMMRDITRSHNPEPQPQPTPEVQTTTPATQVSSLPATY